MAMIQFSCPSCKAEYRVPSKAGGKQATCKSCGESMSVPKSSEASAGASGSGGGSAGNVDLSGLYNSAQAGGAPAVVAPPMDGGSVFASSSRPSRGGPSPVLLVGIGGGVVVLLLAVVLIVVLMGGGGNDPAPNPGAGPATVDNGPSRTRVRGGTRGSRDETDPDETPDPVDPGDETPTPPVAAAQGRLIAPPTAALPGVVDWTLPVPEKVAAFAEQVEIRGMVLTLPPQWQADVTSLKSALSDNTEARDALVQAMGPGILETAVLSAKPRESLVDIRFAMSVSLNPEDVAWPTIRSIDRVSPATLGLDEVDAGALRLESGSANPAVAAAASVLNATTNRFDSASLAYNLFKPEGYYLKEGDFDPVTFGTLFGGHPFARVVLRNEAEATQTLLYVGSVGHMQVTMVATAPAQYAELLDDMDWVIRSAALMTPAQAREYGRSDTVYDRWMGDTFVDVAYAGDTAPHAGLTAQAWDGFTDRSQFQRSAAASIITPYRQPFGIIAPEGLRLATTNRVAARWFPDSNGMWLQMKVTKLEGREQRTMQSPVLPAEGDSGERLFVYSTAIDLPAGYELSELQADEITLHRVLLPAVPGQMMRKVFYVFFDGADQVTIEGHFATTRLEDLEQLDAAAKSLTRI